MERISLRKIYGFSRKNDKIWTVFKRKVVFQKKIHGKSVIPLEHVEEVFGILEFSPFFIFFTYFFCLVQNLHSSLAITRISVPLAERSLYIVIRAIQCKYLQTQNRWNLSIEGVDPLPLRSRVTCSRTIIDLFGWLRMIVICIQSVDWSAWLIATFISNSPERI